jgi:predicted transposase/invertase (TIGR01784 family)
MRELVSFDWAIKKILRNKANFGILEGFLSELFFTDITILELLESESNQEIANDKFNRVDIKVKDSTGKIIIVEIQYSRELDYLQRILYASSKVITEHLKEGKSYAEVSKVISVNILHFDLGKGDDYIYHGTTRFIGLHNHTELELSDNQKEIYEYTTIADIYPEYYLIELRNFNSIAKNSLDEWIYFLKNGKVEDKFAAKGLEQAKESLDVLKMTTKERQIYERFQDDLHYQASMYESNYVLGQIKGEKKGRVEGIKEGIKEGKKEALLITVKNMQQVGIEINIIANVTGLSIEKIKSL